MAHSPPHGYGLVNMIDLPGDEDDIDTRIRFSTQESIQEHQSSSISSRISTASNSTADAGKHEIFVVATSDLAAPTLIREISIDSRTALKISPRQRKSSNVASSELPAAPPPPTDHKYIVIPGLDPEHHTLPPVQTPRKLEQHSIISLPNTSPDSVKKFDEAYGIFPKNTGQEAPREYTSCWGYVNASLLTCIISMALLLLISCAPNIPLVQLDSLSVVKFNVTKPLDYKPVIKGTYHFQLAIKNHETKWRGVFHHIDCTLYKQKQHKNFYEEEAKNLNEITNATINQPFSLEPGAEKEVQVEMEVADMQGLESASFVLWVSAYVSFDRASFQWYSGTLNFNSGTLEINQDTGTLSNHLPVACKFSLPLM